MRRRLLIAAVFLLAGAVVNVAYMWYSWIGWRWTYPVLGSEQPRLGGLLPYEPNWYILVALAAFIGALLWAMIYLPFIAWKQHRHETRQRRGLCPACGYRIGKADVCSECGKVLLGRARVAT